MKMHTQDTDRLFNTMEIADYIKVSRRTISNMIKDKKIPYLKIGKTVRFDPTKVLNALNKYEVPAEIQHNSHN
jgi:excisionase family DNA binding protein